MVRAGLQGGRREMFRALRERVVMVTHELGEAAFFGDTIVLMRDGRIVQRGTLSELSDSPADAFVTRFITAQRSLHEAIGGATK